MPSSVVVLAFVVIVLAGLCVADSATFDVVVYGSTPSGVMAAVTAARMGLSTVLLSVDTHVGGMVSGGLGQTDKGDASLIGGYTLEFFTRVCKKYNRSGPCYTFEPHVASVVFHEMLNEAKVTLVTGAGVVSVSKSSATTLSSITTLNGTFSGKVFTDASYEGDLLPLAGISYTVGREAVAEYNESTNGRMAIPNNYGGNNHQFRYHVNATDPTTGKPLPMIYTGPVAPVGAADKKVQAYNFRMCLTNNPDNMVPFTKPDGYDPARWQLARNFMLQNPYRSSASLTDFMIVSNMPNNKTDINNHGAISTDVIGGSWGWPEASFANRKTMFQAHKQYTEEFFYFMGHDESVPEQVRTEMLSWGLAKDEFVETENWPPQLYVREGRRMIGGKVFIQSDRTTNKVKPSVVGQGGYNMDNHHTERIFVHIDNKTVVRNEGNTEYAGGPTFDLPYWLLLPKSEESTNLLAPVPVSSSHSAYGAVRLEPQWMILGQAAGTAAALAIKSGVSVQAVNITSLQLQLEMAGQILHHSR